MRSDAFWPRAPLCMDEQSWPSHMQISHAFIVAHEEHLCWIAQGNPKAFPGNMIGRDAKTHDSPHAFHSFVTNFVQHPESILDLLWKIIHFE